MGMDEIVADEVRRMGPVEALRWVQFQLEQMVGFRLGGLPSEADEERYQRLCEKELDLLQLGRQVA